MATGGARKTLLEDFSDETSAHGFARLRNSSNSVGKIFWGCAMLGLWCYCGTQIYTTVNTYYEWRTIVSVRISRAADVHFPAVTICNLNPIRLSEFMNHTGFTGIVNVNASTMSEMNAWADKQQQNGGPQVTHLNRIAARFYSKMYNEQLDFEAVGHDIGGMLVECTYQGRQCFPDNFTRWDHPTYGNCYTMFVDDDDGSLATFVGPNYGLSLTLFLQGIEYLPIVSPAAGFRVELHPGGVMPFPHEKGFTLSTGQATQIAVRKKQINRQPKPYDGTDCGTSGHGNYDQFFTFWNSVSTGKIQQTEYSNTACTKSCTLEMLLKECNCVDPRQLSYFPAHFFKTPPPPPCDMENEEIIKCAGEVLLSLASNNSACNEAVCPQPCKELLFDARITSSQWPRDEFFHDMVIHWLKRLPGMDMPERVSPATELSKVEIYFEELNYELIEESKAMDRFALFSAIGGTLGLFAGMSVLTMLEFLELFLRLLFGKQATKTQPNPNPPAMYPISKTAPNDP